MKNAKDVVWSIREGVMGNLETRGTYAVTFAEETEKSIGSRKPLEKEKLKLEEGEVICNKCEGKGILLNSKIDFSFMDETCPICNGEGKTDWISNAIEPPPKDEFYFAKYLVDEMAENLRYKIDKDIMNTFLNGTYQKRDDIQDAKRFTFKNIFDGGSQS